jgi:hypothetical protein
MFLRTGTLCPPQAAINGNLTARQDEALLDARKNSTARALFGFPHRRIFPTIGCAEIRKDRGSASYALCNSTKGKALVCLMENPGSFIVSGYRFAITLDGILSQTVAPGVAATYDVRQCHRMVRLWYLCLRPDLYLGRPVFPAAPPKPPCSR